MASGPETCVECFPLRTSPEGSTHLGNCSCFDLYFENKVGLCQRDGEKWRRWMFDMTTSRWDWDFDQEAHEAELR